jgi:hypothetical protein
MAALIQTILNAGKHVDPKTTMGLFKKAFPKLSKFFNSSVAKGFGANQIINYLTQKTEDRDFLKHLEELHGKKMLTSEEKVLRNQEKQKRSNEKTRNAALSYGASALAPYLLGEEEEAVSPNEITQQPSQLGYEEQKRIGGPMPQQTGPGSVINVPPNERQAQQAQQISNAPQYDPLSTLIQKYPELVQFIQREAQQGSDASTIARRAKSQPFVRKYGPMIDEIENSIDEPFEMLLERLLGSQQPRQAQGQQQGQGNAALQQGLIQAMQQLKKMRGG